MLNLCISFINVRYLLFFNYVFEFIIYVSIYVLNLCIYYFILNLLFLNLYTYLVFLNLRIYHYVFVIIISRHTV